MLAPWQTVLGYSDQWLNGLWLTASMSVVAFVLAFVLGTLGAVARRSRSRPLRFVAAAYVESMRNTPVLLQLFMIVFALPEIGVRLDAWQAGVAALAIIAGAYLTEIFRGGLEAIPARVSEAGRAMGLTTTQRIRLITLPLIFRIVLPSLTNSFISLFKDTSVAAALAVTEVTYAATYVNINTFHVLEAWALASVIYLVVGYALAFGFRGFERRYRLVS